MYLEKAKNVYAAMAGLAILATFGIGIGYIVERGLPFRSEVPTSRTTATTSPTPVPKRERVKTPEPGRTIWLPPADTRRVVPEATVKATQPTVAPTTAAPRTSASSVSPAPPIPTPGLTSSSASSTPSEEPPPSESPSASASPEPVDSGTPTDSASPVPEVKQDVPIGG